MLFAFFAKKTVLTEKILCFVTELIMKGSNRPLQSRYCEVSISMNYYNGYKYRLSYRYSMCTQQGKMKTALSPYPCNGINIC